MENTSEFHTSDGFLSFDPIVLVMDVAKRWLLILMAVLMVGVGTYIVEDASYAPVYQTNTTFVVTTRGSSSTVYSNLSSTTAVASVFSELLNSSMLRKVILEDTGISYFDGTITTSVISETNLLTMQVTASNPRTAFLVTRAIIDHHEELTYQVVGNVTLEVLQEPTVPMGPRNSADAVGKMRNMMIIAAVAAIAVFAWMSFARDAVRSDKEVKSKLDCDYLGEIPHENKYKTLGSWIRHKKTSILITNPITSFRFVETIRKLRRRIEQHMHGDKVLMVTSLLENEGKSTVAVNLALAMAKKYNRVLLIDLDLRKPACHALLEQKDVKAGVRGVLRENAKLSEAVLRYKRTNLYMLLEKKGDRNSGELIASGNMQSLIQWARREFDFVILDLPPMSAASDAEGVMELADASVLVVRQNAATAPVINKAVNALDGGKAKLLGCVLNNVYATFWSSGQGYAYGGYGKYHYGQYGHYDAPASKESDK